MNLVNILFRDVLTIALAIFVAIVAMTAIKQADAAKAAVLPGSLSATISWPAGDIDVDIWLNGPAEPVPVGYSNKGGITWNLLRDDLGAQPDFLPENYENAYSRGLPPGDYRVNVQCYRCPNTPVEVKLEVVRRQDDANTIVGRSTITLRKNHEEKTGLAFRLDEAGNIVPGSMNAIFAPLRSGAK